MASTTQEGEGRWDDDVQEDEVHLDTPFLESTLAWQALPAYHQRDAPLPLAPYERRRVIVRTVVTTVALFAFSVIVVLLILLLALPPMTPEDRAVLRLPRSMHQLQEMSAVCAKYNEEHRNAVLFAWVSVFLFLQTFSIPGAMYMSILAGALWKVPLALPLVCACIATGASLCYLLSWHVGAIFRAIPRWQHRVEAWKTTTQQYRHHMLSYLTMLRMMPVPPHFLVNIMAPHLGIPLSTFWWSTLLGVFCSSLVYTAIGEELGQLAGPQAFHIFTWRNAMLMVLVLMAATLPGMLKSRVQAPEAPRAPGSIRLDEEAPSASSSRAWPSWTALRRAWPWRAVRPAPRPPSFPTERPDEERDESTMVWRTVDRDTSYLPMDADNEHTWQRDESARLLSYAQRASEFAGQVPSSLAAWWRRPSQRA
ncbi:hypothetical protein MNAN1_001520 [Malassezia nana]|uniref:VTT domain-containing protein n=1 Tax=Malassezia nana TaxID=180528 RepID=A0AAF0EQU3_9BASI|nr:hypothetical protein MNAN1_001520 [Malassezia nana]